MSFFDQMYDEMTWQEVCYRLPSELAINALRRRITNLDTLKMFFENVGTQPSGVNELKDHVNNLISDEDVDDILDTFDSDFHPTLFNWLSSSNVARVKDHDPDKLSTKFLFNLTDSKDKDGLKGIFRRILDDDPTQSQMRAVLRKADDVCLPPLLDMLMKDKRPEIKACLLSIPGLTNSELVNDHQKVIGLKAFAKCEGYKPLDSINRLSVNIFSALRPKERIDVLGRYLDYFPNYGRINPFDPEPSEEEFQMILFAGCVEYNDEINKINEKYKLITDTDPPSEPEEEDDI